MNFVYSMERRIIPLKKNKKNTSIQIIKNITKKTKKKTKENLQIAKKNKKKEIQISLTKSKCINIFTY